MLQFAQNVEFENHTNYFEVLSSPEFDFIQQRKKRLKFNKGETICKQGTFAPNIMYLEEGFAKLCFQGANNKNLIIKVIKPYNFIGLSSLCGKNNCYHTVITLTETTVNIIEKDDFKKIILNNSNFASKIIEWYCNNDAFFFSRFFDVAIKQADVRLANAILYLTEIKYNNKNLLSFITRKELAELTNISVECTIRLLSKFKNNGIIDIKGKAITIKRPEILKNISEN